MMKKSLVQIVCLILFLSAPARAIPLVTDPGDQMEPDIYGRYVVYRDFNYYGSYGSGLVLYDLFAGTKTLMASQAVDNNPAVGENRILWCDRRWSTPDNWRMDIVSTVIGSGVEDVLNLERGSTFGLDVNDRWAIWYAQTGSVGQWIVRTYDFSTGTRGYLFKTAAPSPDYSYMDVGVHIDHLSDTVMWRDANGEYWAIDLATGVSISSLESAYLASRHAYYKGISVWQELHDYSPPYTGWDIHISEIPIPEPSGLLALASGLLGLGGVCWRRRKR